MSESNHANHPAEVGDELFDLSALELDQLVENKKQPFPRRRFTSKELAVIWLLRFYVLFMVAAIVVQIIHAH